MNEVKEKYAIAKTTGFVATDKESFEAEVVIRYSSIGELETLTIGDNKTIQFSVSYRAIKDIIAQAK